MGSPFVGLDLFDPNASDEPVSLDDLLPSASAFIDSRPRKNNLGPRSKTDVDLKVKVKVTKDDPEITENDPVGTIRVRTRMASSHSEGDFTSLPPEPQQV